MSKKETLYKIMRKEKTSASIETVSKETGIPQDRLGDIERGEKEPNVQDVAALAKYYNSKRMCKWFCSNECPVGKEIDLIKVDGTGTEDMGLIMLKIIDNLNKLRTVNIDRIVEIAADGVIDESELADFSKLKDALKEISKAYGALLRWEEDGNVIGVPVKKD